MMDISSEAIVQSLNSIRQKLVDDPQLPNHERRKIHVVTEKMKTQVDAITNNAVKQGAMSLLSDIHNKNKLKCFQSKRSIFNFLDDVFRLIAIWLCLITCTFSVALPCLILSPADSLIRAILGLDTRYALNNWGKRIVGEAVLLVSGVATIVTYETSYEETFNSASMVCFSHASTIDAFLVSAAVKIRNYTLAKDDLFFIPFFNIMLLVFGGIPIVRSNLKKAKQSLDYVSSVVGENECISIAPEGTRSKTGQLIEFKKGPFHTWELLQVPIIPMVIVGAFELFPPGQQMNVSGRVYVHFLKPIQVHEADSRDKMSALLRQRMLDYIGKAPQDASAPLTSHERLRTNLAITFLLSIDYLWYQFVRIFLIQKLGLSWKTLLIYFLCATLTSIPAVYVYAVYVQPLLNPFKSNKRLNKPIKKEE